ncbi:MAG: ribonuclease T [Pseudomonadota bacterium]
MRRDGRKKLLAALLIGAIVAVGALNAPRSVRALDPSVDHFVLALTWSPTWCTLRNDPDHPQCDPERDLAWVVHGLWPQHRVGWPDWCETTARPSAEDIATMATVMPTESLADYQWRKHGSCTGWTPEEYAAAVVKAAEGLARPELAVGAADAQDVWRAFSSANPDLPRDSFAVICREAHIYEVRICLDTALSPMACVQEPRRNCQGKNLVPPVL